MWKIATPAPITRCSDEKFTSVGSSEEGIPSDVSAVGDGGVAGLEGKRDDEMAEVRDDIDCMVDMYLLLSVSVNFQVSVEGQGRAVDGNADRDHSVDIADS